MGPPKRSEPVSASADGPRLVEAVLGDGFGKQVNHVSRPSQAAADIAEQDAFALIVEVADMARDYANTKADARRRRLKRAWPDEFADGERCAFLQRFDGSREKGGYPTDFHGWPLDRRNGWYAGYNLGLFECQRALAEPADG